MTEGWKEEEKKGTTGMTGMTGTKRRRTLNVAEKENVEIGKYENVLMC